jgi:phosphohistidine phosphatase SixA
VPDLLHDLSSGGYVIFFRHAARDTTAIATSALAVVDNAGECVPGSELTEAGVADALALRDAFIRLDIHVGRVYASPTCRTTRMAELMFDRYETTRALTWPGMWRPEEEAALTASLVELLATPPVANTDTVLVSHNDVLQAGRVGVALTLDQAEAAVFRPLANGGFELAGRIPKEAWTAPAWVPAGTVRN